MSDNPDVIRADIEQTRRRLGTNVDAVADKVTPSHIIQRRTEKVRNAIFGVKESVMGAADDTRANVRSAMDDAGGSLHDAGEAISDAPHQLAVKAQGNPLAAGLIAFGAGLLVGSLFPASQKEREAAEAVKSAAEPMTSQLTEAAKDVAEGLREPAQEAMENVKATAMDAREHVMEEGQTAMHDVKGRADDARGNVQNM
jgi:ElaB/YqjD/DUF883 family membrane-anchored ribosome-binding protein